MSKTDKPVVFSRSARIADSSTVSSVDFDPNTDTMLVEFHTGARYVYSPVTAHQFGAIISAESVGQTLNILIKENDDVSYVQVD